jgi:hypothetical protein
MLEMLEYLEFCQYSLRKRLGLQHTSCWMSSVSLRPGTSTNFEVLQQDEHHTSINTTNGAHTQLA